MKKFYFTPKNGQANFEDEDEFKIYFKSLPEKRHILTIEVFSETRSLDVNAYYWGVVIPFFLEKMGLPLSESNKDYMHYDVLGAELRMIDDELRPGKKRMEQTRNMNTRKFWQYLKRCEYLCAQYYDDVFPPPKRA